MPIPLSPNDKFWLVLKSDQTMDENGAAVEPQPKDAAAFQFRCLSGRDQRNMAAMLDDLEEQKTTVAAIDKTFEIFRFILAGWRNVRNAATGEEIPYEPKEADTIMTFREAQELIYRVWGWTPDVNFSASQSSTPSGESASPDSAAGAEPAAKAQA